MDEMNLGPEAQELHDSIVAEIQSGVLKLKDGLPFGTGDETEMQYDVTLRELTAGDLIDAQAAAEKLVMSKEGPVLVSSPSGWDWKCCADRLPAWAASKARCRWR